MTNYGKEATSSVRQTQGRNFSSALVSLHRRDLLITSSHDNRDKMWDLVLWAAVRGLSNYDQIIF